MRRFSRLDTIVLAAAIILTPPIIGPAAAQDSEGPDPAQIARGAKAWAENCGRCHNLRSPNELGDFEWHVSVIHMRVRANIPATTIEDIMVFLKSSN
mgnify:CR=1 FL=1